jgi:hypothetical protein
MFDFLFKRSPSKSPPTQVSKRQHAQHKAEAAESANAIAVAAAAAEAMQQAKQAAQQRAMTFAADEAAAVEFILQCEFADARLTAAGHVHAKPMLERVYKAIRNTDRRVAKLMHQRLEIVAQQEARQQKAQACIASAHKLLQEAVLAPNHVAELDRAWQSIGDIGQGAAVGEFESARAALGARLQAQTQLQRAVIDALASLHQLAAAPDLTPMEWAQQIDALKLQMDAHRANTEVASLPKHLLPEFDREYDQCKRQQAAFEQQHAALAMRQDALTEWEVQVPATLKGSYLKRRWSELGALPSAQPTPPLQARFDLLLQQVIEQETAKRDPGPAPVGNEEADLLQQQFNESLDAMERALEQGLLQQACEHDRKLRDLKAVRPSEAQAGRLSHHRAQLHHLQDWAKWGGNVSREELIKTVEELPFKSLAVTELAKKVGSLRERWKSLDTSAGSAPKPLWERFDSACTIAYAPAAAHFKKLAEERQQNTGKAQALLEEVAQFSAVFLAAQSDGSSVDWKDIAGFCQRVSQNWERLGTIERKDKKRLDGECASALQTVLGPLGYQRQLEVARREKLIADVGLIHPTERGSLDALRALQERWQEQSKALPLERHAEQVLWQRFRGACDALFAARKESASVADAERRSHLAGKEALCLALEAALDPPDAASTKLLRDSASDWSGIGAVPRASEQQIEQRYQAARTALQQRIESMKRDANLAQVDALRAKRHLCQELEAALGGIDCASDVWLARWHVLPVLAAANERAMSGRFQAALACLPSGGGQYITLLEKNRAVLLSDLLRLEIALGLESPAQFSGERLKMQIEALQSSLKSGRYTSTNAMQLLKLLALPALVDMDSSRRIDQLQGALII